MGNFNKGKRFNDRKGGGGFGRRDSSRVFNNRGDSGARPAMHKAVCAECGDPCEVPFRPTGDKPVYCNNCFKGKDSSFSSNRSNGGRDFGKSNFRDKKMFKAVCTECGDPCEVPFRPTGDKPVLCSSCFGQDSRANNKRVENGSSDSKLEQQLKTINQKLDEILKNFPKAEVKKLIVDKPIKTEKDLKLEVKDKKVAKATKTPKVTKKAKVAKKTSK